MKKQFIKRTGYWVHDDPNDDLDYGTFEPKRTEDCTKGYYYKIAFWECKKCGSNQEIENKREKPPKKCFFCGRGA